MGWGARFLASEGAAASRACSCWRFARVFVRRGQATVEGAFLIPVILLMLMMLVQPGILLYDRMVMNAAASEGCRLIATCPAGEAPDVYEGYVRRRLGSIPQQDNFHVHGSGCTWDISLEGGEETDRVSVTIGNQVKPLPFFDFGARALGVVNDKGNFEMTVRFSIPAKSSWVVENDQGLDPEAWVASEGSTAGRGTS